VVRVSGYRSRGHGSIPGRKSSGCGLETENTAVGIRRADHVAPSIRKKMAVTSPTNGGRSVDIVRSGTQATEFSLEAYSLIGVHDESVSRKSDSNVTAEWLAPLLFIRNVREERQFCQASASVSLGKILG
jgi:hypothetical protein